MNDENKKSDLVFIKHILESINAIEEFSKGIDKEELRFNRMKQSAIIREIEIIGEAVKNVSDELRKNNPHVLWKEIAGTRDNIIHHYFGIDLEIIWNIITHDIKELKELKKQIERIEKSLISKT